MKVATLTILLAASLYDASGTSARGEDPIIRRRTQRLLKGTESTEDLAPSEDTVEIVDAAAAHVRRTVDAAVGFDEVGPALTFTTAQEIPFALEDSLSPDRSLRKVHEEEEEVVVDGTSSYSGNSTGDEPAASTTNIDNDAVCSCSPRTYTMRLTLTQPCTTDDLWTNDGIESSLCITSVHNSGGDVEEEEDDDDNNILESQRLRLSDETSGANVAFAPNNDDKNAPERQSLRISENQLQELKIVDVQFVELARDANLTVLNQDNSYSDVALRDGDTVTFQSVIPYDGATLDDEGRIPVGGVQVAIRGVLEVEKEGEDGNMVTERKIVSQHITWSYTGDCDVLPVVEGDRIGWITFERLLPAPVDYCPVAPPPPPPHRMPYGKSSKAFGNSKGGKISKAFGGKSGKSPDGKSSKVFDAKGGKNVKIGHEKEEEQKKEHHKKYQLFGKSSKVLDAKGGKADLNEKKGKKQKEEHYGPDDHKAKVHKHDNSAKSTKANGGISMPQQHPFGKSSKVLLSKAVQDGKQSALSSKSHKDTKSSKASPSDHELEGMDAKAKKKISTETKSSKVAPSLR